MGSVLDTVFLDACGRGRCTYLDQVFGVPPKENLKKCNLKSIQFHIIFDHYCNCINKAGNIDTK